MILYFSLEHEVLFDVQLLNMLSVLDKLFIP